MQTARMGDVLQTTPLIRHIREQYPDAVIDLMVRRMGRAIAERNPDINGIILYDEDTLFQDLRAEDSLRLLKAYRATESLVDTIRTANYDVIYNCTHSLSSAMLLRLTEPKKIVGADLGDAGQFVLRGPWTNYFFTCVFHREYNDLNLCDINRRFIEPAPPVAGLVLSVHDEDRAFVRELFAAHQVGEDDFVVCMQLGASEENKRWADTHFAALARMLAARRNARIFLLGVPEEAPLGAAFETNAPGLAIHLFGKTTIPQVAALLERANLLVTNDTGTMHIAAAVNCPIVLTSVGYVHFRETGPFGAGHCAIERRREHVGRPDNVPGGLEERTFLSPDCVLKAAELLLATPVDAPVPQRPPGLDAGDIDLYMTRFAPDGCLEWYPVIRRGLEERDALRIAYRAMWLDHFGALPAPSAERESIALMLCYYDVPAAATRETWRGQFGEAFGGLARLAEKGVYRTHDLLEQLRHGNARKAQETVRELMALDEEMRLFGELHPPCKPLTLIARYERDNLEGADPRQLAQTTRIIYQACQTRATLLLEKIDALFALMPA